MSKTTKHIVYGAVLAAMAVVLCAFVRFPIFPSAPYLEYDMGDVPLFFGAVLLGPYTGLLITLVACIVQGLTVSAESGILGILMHFFATGSFVLCVGLITKRKSAKRVVPAHIFGAVTQILVMIPLNLIFTPAFFVKEGVFRAVGENAYNTLLAIVSFPKNSLAVICGVLAALAFAVAFFVALIYTVKEKSKRQKEGLAISAKGVAFGVIAGLIYGTLVLIAVNLLFGNVPMPDGMKSVADVMFVTIVPFNAIKAGGNALLSCALFMLLGKG